MQYRITYKIITGCWVCSSLMLIASTVMADSNVMPTHSIQLLAEQTNPWLLPEKQEDMPDFKKFPNYHNQKNQESSKNRQGQGARFVTPDIIESLEQQQKKHQLMQDNSQYQQRKKSQSGQEYYGYPPGGMNYLNPVYDTPAVSPWGSGLDTLYRGNSFPWVPSEAIGGISPMPMTSFGEDGSSLDSDNAEKRKENKVFNPYTFIRD